MSNFTFCNKMFISRLLQMHQNAPISVKILKCFEQIPLFSKMISKFCLLQRYLIEVIWKMICLTLSHIQEICSRRLIIFCQKMKNLYNWMENIVTNGEIAQNEQFLHLPQSFRLYSVIIPTIIEIWEDIFKVVCCRIVICRKGLRVDELTCTNCSILSVYVHKIRPKI